MSPAIMPNGTSAVAAAAMALTGAGQPTSRYSTAATSATPAARTDPMAAHCIRSRSLPAMRRYRSRAAGKAQATTAAQTSAATVNGTGWPATASPAPETAAAA